MTHDIPRLDPMLATPDTNDLNKTTRGFAAQRPLMPMSGLLELDEAAACHIVGSIVRATFLYCFVI
jgi:hypothetical protein